MGKRILIISYFFAPQNAMGAVRPTKLAKYLSRMGHEVTVLCGPGMNDRRDPTLARDLAALRVYRVVKGPDVGIVGRGGRLLHPYHAQREGRALQGVEARLIPSATSPVPRP